MITHTAERLMTTSFWIEPDSTGELQVPAEALWGAQKQRAAQNVPISGLTLSRACVVALGLKALARGGIEGGTSGGG
jgi:fumarate hydratase, class II